MRPPPEPGPAAPLASVALATLVALAVLSPWGFGAVLPEARLAVTAAALAVSALVLLAGAIGGGLALPAVPLWPLAGFLAVAALQLVPLPEALHRLVAPGSHAAWHPADPLVAERLGAVARPLSLDPDTTLRAIALTGGLALLALVAAPALTRPRATTVALAVVAAVGFALAAYAIWARARYGTLLYGRFTVPTIAPFGPFVSKNHFAGWTVMAALLVAGLAFGLADGARRRGRDWTADPRAAGVILAVVAALALALAALVSLSRGGAMAFAAGAACLLALRLGAARGRGGLVVTLLPALVLGGILAGLMPGEAHERVRSLSGASFRIDTWKDTARLAARSPVLGYGLGAFHDAYPRFKRGHGIVRVEHSENDYLETLAETGVVGLGFALTGLVLLLAGGLGGASAPLLVRGAGEGAAAALVALAVHSLVDFNLRIPSNAALAALAAATVAAAAGTRRRPAPRLVAIALAALVLGVGALAARLPERPDLAARAELEAAAAARLLPVRQLRLERAEAALAEALQRRPAAAESWLMLASTESALGHADRAAAYARHALLLDPERPGLRELVTRLGGAPP